MPNRTKKNRPPKTVFWQGNQAMVEGALAAGCRFYAGYPISPAQGDVLQARWGTHGDHPIIVLSVSTPLDCYRVTLQAFNLSEKYRTPVIILSDEVVAHTRETFALPLPQENPVAERLQPTVPPEWFIPYETKGRLVPAMSAFGDGYRYHVTGLTHDVRGFPTNRPEEVTAFQNRLQQKISENLPDIQWVEPYRVDDAEQVVIAYGSVARSALHAVRLAREMGLKAGLLKLITLFPFPRAALEQITATARVLICPEMNWGQISREVKRVNRGRCRVLTLNKFDGTLITPQEILKYLAKNI